MHRIDLLVGLGNPGPAYAKTRHNIGFCLLDRYVAGKDSSWTLDSRCDGLVTSFVFGSRKIFCLKPQTFMNLSGRSVQKFCSYFKIEPENVLVVCDDISIPFHAFKVSTTARTAGHNGVKNIALLLGEGFVRYRVGVGNKPKYMRLDDYVLGQFSEDEWAQIPSIASTFEKNIEVLIDKGVEKGLNFIKR